MLRKVAIGAAWWLAVAYAFQVVAMMHGLPAGVGPLAALPFAVLAAAAAPHRVRRPADHRRIYQPKAESPELPGEPAILSGR